MEEQTVADLMRCIRCGKPDRKLPGRKKKIESEEDVRNYSLLLKKNIQKGRFICDKCRKLIYKHSQLTLDDCRVDMSTSASTFPSDGPYSLSAQNEGSQSNCVCVSCGESIQHIGENDIEIEEPAEVCGLQVYLNKNVRAGDRICVECYIVAEKMLNNFSNPSHVLRDLNVVSEDNAGACDDLFPLPTADGQPIMTEFDTHSQSSSYQATSCESDDEDDSDTFSVPESSTNRDSSVSRVEMTFKRVVSTHKYCFICGPAQISGIHRISLSSRIDCFTRSRIYIPKGNRCCSHHLLNEKFYEEDIKQFRVVSPTSFVATDELEKFINVLSDLRLKTELLHRIESREISDGQLKAFTGLTWTEIDGLCGRMISMRKSSGRSKSQALITFLMKLRTGMSNELLAATLGVKNHQTVAHYCDSVETSFKDDILPTNFGFKSQTREFLLDQTSEIAKKLHNLDNRLALICDGTYIKHEKSRNNVYQKKSYSGQKKYNLCKPFTICCTNGFIVDVPGPFYATQNDAQILRTIIDDESNGFKALLRPGDVFILDRGFRDVKSYLEDMGYVVLMPSLKSKQHRQLSCKDANLSRLVTKVLWVVEAIHGAICQKFKYFHNQVHNSSLPRIGTLCKIVNFLQNEFGTRLSSDANMVEDILDRINQTKDLENPFAEQVMEQNWNRKKLPFTQLISSDIPDFPILSESSLKIFFTGTYQFGLAVAYLATIICENTIQIKYLKESTETCSVIRAEVPSRHTKKLYRCYLQYYPKKNDIGGILGYACECANGLRTIGSCAHLAAIIYYLSFARYQSRILQPAERPAISTKGTRSLLSAVGASGNKE